MNMDRREDLIESKNKQLMHIEMAHDIDWFDFETRMRKLIHEMIEPTVRKVNEDRDKVFKLKNGLDLQRKKLDDLEFAGTITYVYLTLVIKTDNKTNVFDEIFRSIARLVRISFAFYK